MAGGIGQDEWLAELARLTAKDDEGMSTEEMCDATGLSDRTVGKYLRTANKLEGRLPQRREAGRQAAPHPRLHHHRAEEGGREVRPTWASALASLWAYEFARTPIEETSFFAPRWEMSRRGSRLVFRFVKPYGLEGK